MRMILISNYIVSLTFKLQFELGNYQLAFASFQMTQNINRRFQDFQIIQTLESTHGGQTVLYVVRQQDKIIICKAIQKSSFKDAKSVQHIKNQKQALMHFTNTKSKSINNIISTFQDSEKLYLLLEIVQGLPLHKLLKMVQKLNAEFTKLIVTQVGLIMKKIHQDGFIYRDIKASNFIINCKGRVTMIDLGKAKKINCQRTFTICGTTHSMPPQVYTKQGYSYQFDYYSFGVLIYELLTGTAPFGYGEFSEELLQNMKIGLTELHLLKIQDEITRDLIKRLMEKKQTRLGIKGGFSQILEHQYFNCPEFLDYMDIFQGQQQVNKNDQNFQFYLSEIEDFGLDLQKYNEVQPDDPFYKFFG